MDFLDLGRFTPPPDYGLYFSRLEYVYCGTIGSPLENRQLATIMKIADRYNMPRCLSYGLLRLRRQMERTDDPDQVVDGFLQSLTEIDAPNIRDIFEDEDKVLMTEEDLQKLNLELAKLR